MNLEDITLDQTCFACPEQYDAYYNGEIIGYLILRHGVFRVDYITDDERKVIYHAQPNGDGIFEPEERNFYLTEAKKAIIKAMTGEELNVQPEVSAENILKIEFIRGILLSSYVGVEKDNYDKKILLENLKQSMDILGKITGIPREYIDPISTKEERDFFPVENPTNELKEKAGFYIGFKSFRKPTILLTENPIIDDMPLFTEFNFYSDSSNEKVQQIISELEDKDKLKYYMIIE